MLNVDQLFAKAKRGKKGCLFCKPFEEMVLFETAFFRVLVDTFPLAPGHLMISTKDHYGCAGEIPMSKFAEFEQLKEWVRSFLLQFSEHVCFYEHGRAGGCTTVQPGLKCEHFHLHCLPVKVDITKELNDSYFPTLFQGYKNISELFFEQGDYLFFETVDGNMYFYAVGNKSVQSHLLRSLIADKMGASALANWEEFRDENLLKVSYDKILEHFQGNFYQEVL